MSPTSCAERKLHCSSDCHCSSHCHVGAVFLHFERREGGFFLLRRTLYWRLGDVACLHIGSAVGRKFSPMRVDRLHSENHNSFPSAHASGTATFLPVGCRTDRSHLRLTLALQPIRPAAETLFISSHQDRRLRTTRCSCSRAALAFIPPAPAQTSPRGMR
jgi:hypothetical protein